jgi:nucleoside-diphosphate-sugar epimerase
VRAAVRRGAADDSGLEVVAAELTADQGWAAAAASCEEVYHTASPMVQSDDPDGVIVPARDGTLRVLQAARDAGVRRVVLTSSFAPSRNSDGGHAQRRPRSWKPPRACATSACWRPSERRAGAASAAAARPGDLSVPG